MAPKVSIIVPCKSIGPFARECVEHCGRLNYQDFEVFVLPDDATGTEQLNGAQIIPTGPMGPSAKRDLGASIATGEILAFIDDDAFPRADWLANAVPAFSDDSIGAVGGPAVTPQSDGFLEKASGMVFQSLLGGGPHSYRYTPGPFKIIDDYPSCNLLVRKSTFQRAGGFGTEYWPGEDTKLCLSITKELGESIVYVPNALVYHHRRNLFRGHVNQVKSYALHRGYFVKRYPETSRRFNYFLPSFLLVGIVIGLPLLLVPTVGNIYLAGIAAYLALIGISTAMVSWRNVKFFPLVGLGTVMTQLVYGAWFLKGLFTRNMSH